MFKITKSMPKLNRTVRKAVKQTVKDFQSQGYLTTVKLNKKGTAAVLGYVNQGNQGLVISNAISPDGKQLIKTYDTFFKEGTNTPFQRIIETWEKLKKQVVFKERTTIQYDSSKIPSMVSTMKLDKGCDGVEIVTKYPFEKYAKIFQKKS